MVTHPRSGRRLGSVISIPRLLRLSSPRREQRILHLCFFLSRTPPRLRSVSSSKASASVRGRLSTVCSAILSVSSDEGSSGNGLHCLPAPYFSSPCISDICTELPQSCCQNCMERLGGRNTCKAPDEQWIQLGTAPAVWRECLRPSDSLRGPKYSAWSAARRKGLPLPLSKDVCMSKPEGFL